MKILIIQLRRIGDILLTTPAVNYIKEMVPQSTIDFLCEPMGKDILSENPHINEVFIYDKKSSLQEILKVRSRHYDLVIDFMGNPRTAYLVYFSGAKWRAGFNHRFRSFFYNLSMPLPDGPEYGPNRKIRLARYALEKCGVKTFPPKSVRPQIFLTSEDENYVNGWLKSEAIHKNEFVVLAPVHRKEIRQWRPNGFQEVALHLKRNKKLDVYLAWGPGEESIIAEIRKNLTGEIKVLPLTNLRQMAAIFSRALFVVSNDSGAMHLSVSVNTPTITIYGPTRPIDWNPSLSGYNQGHYDSYVMAEEVACLGCHLSACYVGHLCMENLHSKKVTHVCDELIRSLQNEHRNN